MPNFTSFLHGNNLSLIELQITKIVCVLLSEGELCVLGITDSSRFSCFISFKKVKIVIQVSQVCIMLHRKTNFKEYFSCSSPRR